jgi:hypothetical protein
LGGAAGIDTAVPAESLSVVLVFVFFETGEETAAAFFIVFTVFAAAVGRTADPRGSVIFESPVAAEKMSAVGFRVRTTGKAGGDKHGDGEAGDKSGEENV